MGIELFLGTVFVLLVTATVIVVRQRMSLWNRERSDWFVDLLGLFIQGTLVPLFQVLFVFKFLDWLLPDFKGVWELNLLQAFLLNFVVVDYLYYWNHRLLHSPVLWAWHKVHHESKAFDVLMTSRNSILSSFLIVYVWINGLNLFLLKDASGYAWGLALTAALDMWRHTTLIKNTRSRWYRILGLVFVMPHHHSWHHSGRPHAIYGANFNIWDRLHSTFKKVQDYSHSHGIPTRLSLVNKLFFPYHVNLRKGLRAHASRAKYAKVQSTR